jgi:hypothetical protein
VACGEPVRFVAGAGEALFEVTSVNTGSLAERAADAGRIPAVHKGAIIIYRAFSVRKGLRSSRKQTPQFCNGGYAPVIVTPQRQFVTVLDSLLGCNADVFIVEGLSLGILPAQVGVGIAPDRVFSTLTGLTTTSVNPAGLNTHSAV